MDQLGNGFQLLAINADTPAELDVAGIRITSVAHSAEPGSHLAERYLGDAPTAVYLMRPDQHVAARWETYNAAEVEKALMRAIGH